MKMITLLMTKRLKDNNKNMVIETNKYKVLNKLKSKLIMSVWLKQTSLLTNKNHFNSKMMKIPYYTTKRQLLMNSNKLSINLSTNRIFMAHNSHLITNWNSNRLFLHSKAKILLNIPNILNVRRKRKKMCLNIQQHSCKTASNLFLSILEHFCRVVLN